MTLATVSMRPGINRDITRRQNEGGWSDANLVRFRQGLPETVGGWVKIIEDQVVGVPRKAWTWTSITGEQYVAVGTHLKLYLINRQQLYDITPVRRAMDLNTDPLSILDSTSLVRVFDPSHGAQAGDIVTLTGALGIANVPAASINGQHIIKRIISSDEYEFEVPITANANAIGGGADINAAYEIHAGLENSGLTSGWGTGKWGRGGWLFKGGSSQTVRNSRTWSLDNWGEYLIASPSGGGIYQWRPEFTPTSRAIVVPNAPTQNDLVLVSGDDRHLISYGNNIGGTYDPLFVAWCSQGDFEAWTPSSTNTAGDYRASHGNRFTAALRGQGEILIWTDTNLYSQQFIGPPYIFKFSQIGSNCGSVSPMSPVVADGQVYWKGRGEFFTYNGTVNTLACTVMEEAFDTVNALQEFKMFTAPNTQFNEIWFFHPSDQSPEVDSYVMYNYLENTWSCGNLARSAWVDQNTFKNPIAFSPDGYMYTHEFGETADGELLGDFIESGDIDIGEGDQASFIDRIVPDFLMNGRIGITLRAKQYPNSKYNAKGPHPIRDDTRKINVRIRGRSIAFRLESLDAGSKWRYGAVRADIWPDGGRG